MSKFFKCVVIFNELKVHPASTQEEERQRASEKKCVKNNEKDNMKKSSTEAFVVDILLYSVFLLHFSSHCSLSYLRFFNPYVFNAYNSYNEH